MIQPLKTFKVENLAVEIHYDEESSNDPREHDNISVLVCHHRRLNIDDPIKSHGIDWRRFDSEKELKAAIEEKHGADLAVIAPLYFYEHGGCSISLGDFGDRWDSGQIGWAFATWTRARELHSENVTAEQIKEAIRCEVSEYNSFLRGEVYGYVIKDGREVVDSCWGFIGDSEYVEREARSAAQYAAKERADTAVVGG